MEARMTREQSAQQRAREYRAVSDRPTERRFAENVDGSRSRVPATIAVRDQAAAGVEPVVFGNASVTDRGYEMWDMFGPYTELVDGSAFDNTLAAEPLVEFALNHGRGGGAPMAHTRNGTLDLTVEKGGDDPGLHYAATLDPTRGDVSDMLKAVQRGDLAEASFKFTIVRGQWSPDWTEYHIEEIDLDRGDVSVVNFGANPNAHAGARSVAAVLTKIEQGRALDPEDVSKLTQAMAWFTAIDSIVDEAQEALAVYLGVASPDPDDSSMSEKSITLLDTARRVLISDADTRHRSIA